jgi:hypothetical protein
VAALSIGTRAAVVDPRDGVWRVPGADVGLRTLTRDFGDRLQARVGSAPIPEAARDEQEELLDRAPPAPTWGTCVRRRHHTCLANLRRAVLQS